MEIQGRMIETTGKLKQVSHSVSHFGLFICLFLVFSFNFNLKLGSNLC